MKVLVIANPIAGGGLAVARSEALQQALSDRGAHVDVYFTQAPGDAAERAKDVSTFDCVVSVGGDGSANEVASGLSGGDIPLAILPMGTANVLASELGHPGDPVRLADIIMNGNVRRIDRGIHDNGHFVMCAGAGLDAAIVQEVAAHRGKTLGYTKWVRPVLELLASYTYPPFKVYIDDHLVCEEAQYAVAGNCRYSAGVLCLTPEAQLDDGLLDVCICHHVDSIIMVRLALESFGPGFAQNSDIIYKKGREIRMEPIEDTPVPVQIDGDPGGTLPLNIRVDPSALPVVTR